MTTGYRTYDVLYEHSTADSDNVRQNRIVVTAWGGKSEFKMKSEIERQRPSHRDIVILDIEER
jgi:hypothetical protein